jgi:hypothetical protein
LVFGFKPPYFALQVSDFPRKSTQLNGQLSMIVENLLLALAIRRQGALHPPFSGRGR